MKGDWLSQQMMRRDSISGCQPTGCQLPCSLIQSSISERALARVIAESAARRWRSYTKLNNMLAHSSDGGVISNGVRRSQITTLPAKAKRPA